MNSINPNIVESCRQKLIEIKSELLNTMSSARQQHFSQEVGSDETDLAAKNLAENQFISKQERRRKQLIEIEFALSRIANGTYGICEETHEPIEPLRLQSIPWTRLSIEGAEIREAVQKKFAR